MSGRHPPRPLTPREKEALDFLLACDFPGAEILRQQGEAASVVWRCTCGCATVSLAVDSSKAPAAPIADGIAVEAQTKGITDDPEFVQLLLFVERGWLESLEIVYFQDYIPDEFPSPNSFEPPFTPKMRHSESL